MTYIFIPIGLLLVLTVYALYLFAKRDFRQLKAIAYPSLFFLLVWVGIYYFLLT